MNSKTGVLSVIATPIGNLGDLSPRAVETLRQADLILAEDTRHAGVLLRHHQIKRPLMALHQHNERSKVAALLARIRQGEQIALISDAGTPLISDPGFVLVRALRQAGLPVVTLPGASALTAALSVCGIAADRFCFEGFLPHKSEARQAHLQQLAREPRTLVFYESSHRLLPSLQDMLIAFGPQRSGCVAREMTKKFESYYFGTLEDIQTQLHRHPDHQKGEFVLIIAGASQADANRQRHTQAMQVLLRELPLKKASAVAAELLQMNKNELYRAGLALRQGTGTAGKPDSDE